MKGKLRKNIKTCLAILMAGSMFLTGGPFAIESFAAESSQATQAPDSTGNTGTSETDETTGIPGEQPAIDDEDDTSLAGDDSLLQDQEIREAGAEDEPEEEEEESQEEAEPAGWPEQGVNGSDSPTLEAKSVEEFNKNGNGGKDAEKNLYTMTVATGIKPGKSVHYFAVRYTDTSGSAQTKYILMSDNPVKESYTYMNKNGGENKDMTARHKVLSDLNYKVSTPSDPKALGEWSVNEILFKTETEIAEINDIQIFMEKGSWTVQGLVVSKVTKMAGYGEMGFYSGQYFFGMNKQRICNLQKKKSGTLTLSAVGDTLLSLAGDDSIYFGLEKAEAGTEDTMPFNDLYTFRVDFADVLDGGIESYLNQKASEASPVPKGFVEHLALTVEYRDKNGWTRNVTMPVVMSALGQYLTSGDNVWTMGMAQRGETIAFTGCLPDFDTLLTTTLYSGEKARKQLKETGGFENTGDSSMTSSLNSDNYSIAGVSLYKGTCRLSNTEDGTDIVTNDKLTSYTTAYSFSEEDPLYYFTTNVEGGRKLAPSSKEQLRLDTYEAGAPLLATPTQGNLLIRLLTDPVSPNSGSNGEVMVRLNYRDSSDKKRSSMPFYMKDLSNKYMGHWPSTKGVRSDFAYSHGMNPGNYLEVPVTIDDITTVEDMDISLSGGADEYQISAISICSVENIGRRRIYKQGVKGYQDDSTYRVVRDNNHAEIAPFPMMLKNPMLLTAGEVQTLTVSGSEGAGTIRMGAGFDYNTVRYSMTYEQTKMDLGFVRAQKSYDVNVKVAEDSETANSNGDSGSSNQFFFQLQFKNGNSGYVLANQQLASDSFRAGYQELFNISVNRDYGQLTSIRIIPEDVQTDDIFDKLNIEQITVTEKTNGGAAVEYVFDNVGWIDIDYTDSAEASSIRGQKGRSAEQLARRFRVSYHRKVVNLLCEISTLPYDGAEELPPKASVCCDLHYIDTNNNSQTIGFDIVKRMADYMKMTPTSYEAPTDGSQDSYYKNMGTISNPTWMLRANHTDRFIMPGIPNLKSIDSIDIYATNRQNGTVHWVVGGVMISEVLEDGPLQITADNEYYRNLNTNPLCRSMSVNGIDTMTLTSGTLQKIDNLKFSPNELVYEAGDAWVTPVTRLPEAESDELNVFIYPSAGIKDVSGVKVKFAAKYSKAFSQVAQATKSSMATYGSGTDNAMFYTTGLDVKGMMHLNSIGIGCVNSKIAFNHAIVQHVREGVIIANYYVPLLDGSAVLGLTGNPSNAAEVAPPSLQKLYVSLGKDTTESTLVPVDNDIAVSFEYKSSLYDQNASENKYSTPYIYLTDVGYTKIGPGMMLEIPFEVPFMAEVTGYRIGCFGNVKASVDGAAIANYSYDKKEEDKETKEVTYVGLKKNDVYSFNQAEALGNVIKYYKVTAKGMTGDDSVNLLDLNFNTAAASTAAESGTTTPVKMAFTYMDHRGRLMKRTVDDIRPYIQSDTKNMETGKTTNIKLFLWECSDLIYIDIQPQEEENKTPSSWNIESISGSLSLGDKLINRAVDKTFTEAGKGTIYLKEVRLETKVKDPSGTTSLVTDHTFTTIANADETVTIMPHIAAGGGTYFANAYWVVNGVDTKMNSKLLQKGSGGSFIFTAPKNTTTSAQTYKVVIASSVNPEVADTIYVTVPVPEPETPAQEQPKEETGTETDTQTETPTDSTDSTDSTEETPQDNP